MNHRFRSTLSSLQRGLTVVEILVSLVIMSVVTLATVALFTTTSESYRSVDADQELQDSGRFALDLIGYAVRHAGYQERVYLPPGSSDVTDLYFPSIKRAVDGVDNSQILSGNSGTDFGAEASNNGLNSSDVLTVRFFGAARNSNSTDTSNSMQSCLGDSLAYPIGEDALIHSTFYVKQLNDEFELYCKAINPATGNFGTNPIVRGVENFQIVFGVSNSNTSTVPTRWLNPDQMVADDWGRIMSVKVGLVIRGPVGSAPAPISAIAYYPLGEAFAAGATTASLKFIPPTDTRMRRVFTATFKVRNHTIGY